MPDPKPRSGAPLAIWPATLPGPQAQGFTINGPPRAEPVDVMSGSTRLSMVARTAPMDYAFTCYFTQEQMEIFEGWYRDAVETHDGEFYAHWIGGARIVAFAQPYEYSALGKGWILTGRVIRTRIDPSACDDFINATFGAIYRAELTALDIYRAELTAPDIYKDDFPLGMIADNEC